MQEKPFPTRDEIKKAQKARLAATVKANMEAMSEQTKRVVQPAVPYDARTTATTIYKSQMR